MAGCTLLALGFHARVDLVELDLVDLLALQQLGIAGVVDLDFLQHLANDHLDVLVVDVDALKPIHLLNFVHEVGSQFFDALDGKNVVRSGIALNDIVALLDDVSVLKMNVLAFRDQVLLRLLAFRRRLDRDAALVLVVLAEPHRTPISAMIAASFGRRASNSSATRGRPPVMSRVLALSVGIRAMTSPGFTSSPS